MPAKIRSQVLSEFSHQCAICKKPKPHLHHIDENHDNHDPYNLLPLCPNHHLVDQHDPTRKIEPGRLGLFRRYKDPAILWPQFQPLYKRMRFLECEEAEIGFLQGSVLELASFVSFFEMGEFYAQKILALLPPAEKRSIAITPFPGSTPENPRATANQIVEFTRLMANMSSRRHDAFRKDVVRHRNEIYALIVEMLRYQRWPHPDEL